jgi:hypothetical protein
LSPRFVNCEVCQTEGRILTNSGGPDDVDHGVCPECNGERVVEVETHRITIDDLEENMADRPYQIYRHSAVGRVLYDTQCTQEAADASVLTGTGAHPGQRFEIVKRGDLGTGK